MKKIYLIVGTSLISQELVQAQDKRLQKEEKINKNEIELVYNHYIQEGQNSAVTGGTGTEALKVYGPSLKYNRIANKNSFGFTLGADIITSASIDKIDFVTSASRVDTRSYINAQYQRKINNYSLLLGGSGSIESDYFSLGTKAGMLYENPDKLIDFSVILQMYFDDLRWGRFSETQKHKPTHLIYPVELRYKEWYDTYRRNSYNIKSSVNFVVNKYNRVGLGLELNYQEGLLATPFHRIYFRDGKTAVEQLPKERYKAIASLKWNKFISGKYILKSTLAGFKDNWGINSVTLDEELVIKFNKRSSVIPNIRFYSQSGSKYFNGYKAHNSAEAYYTSDYDLSKFTAYTLGVGYKYSPFRRLGKIATFKNIQFNYSYYQRSNKLNAHILTVAFQLE